MEGLVFNSDFRQRVATSNVNESIVVSYDIRQKTNEPVQSVVGGIHKNGIRVGSVSVDMRQNSLYIAFEKFDAVTADEREAVFLRVNKDIEPLLAAK